MYIDKVKNYNMVLNEAYFGRTPGIMKCLKALSDFRSKYLGRGLNAIKHIAPDSDKDLHKFCDEIEREFGLYSFALIIKNSIEHNACTMPIYFKMNRSPRENVVKDKDGYRFKKDIEMSIYTKITTSIILNEKFTDEEVLAILLHEIGHNFQEYLNDTLNSLQSCIGIVELMNLICRIISMDPNVVRDIPDYLLITNGVHKVVSKFYRSITNTDRANIYSYFNFLRGIVGLPLELGNSIISAAIGPVVLLWNGFISTIRNVTSIFGVVLHTNNYFGEIMADNFAGYYGFGPELNSALNKLSTTHLGSVADAIAGIPVIGNLYSLALLPGLILLDLGDVHPANAVRARNSINSLERSIKNDKDTPPKVKKELVKDIERYKKNVNEFYDHACAGRPGFIKACIDRCAFNDSGGGFKNRLNITLFGDPDKEVERMDMRLKEESTDLTSNISKCIIV